MTLDTIVEAYLDGATAEEVAQQYSISLGDIHATFSFYLSRKADMDQYLREREAKSIQAREYSHLRSDGSDLRQRLLARRHDGDQLVPHGPHLGDESDIIELIRANPDRIDDVRQHLATVHPDYVNAFDRFTERARDQRDE